MKLFFSEKQIMRENKLYVIHLFRDIAEWAWGRIFSPSNRCVIFQPYLYNLFPDMD